MWPYDRSKSDTAGLRVEARWRASKDERCWVCGCLFNEFRLMGMYALPWKVALVCPGETGHPAEQRGSAALPRLPGGAAAGGGRRSPAVCRGGAEHGKRWSGEEGLSVRQSHIIGAEFLNMASWGTRFGLRPCYELQAGVTAVKAFCEPSEWTPTLLKVKQLRDLATDIEGFFGTVDGYSNLPLEVVLKQHPGFQAAVLGGVGEDGDYREHSLAKVYREQLGIWIDTKQYAALAPFGEADRRVTLETGESGVRLLATSVRALCDKVIRAWGTEIPADGDHERPSAGSYLGNPPLLIHQLTELLQLLAGLSAGADPGTTLAFMTRRITGHYLRSSFLQDAPEQAEPFLRNRLGLQPLWEPEVAGNDYTVWGYPDHVDRVRPDWYMGDLKALTSQIRTIAEKPHTFGASLLALNRLAWLLFHPVEGSAYSPRPIAAAVLAEVPDLFGAFWARAEPLLRAVPRPSGEGLEEQLEREREIEIKGSVAEILYETSRGRRYATWSGPVYRLLDWLIPAVVYGQYGFDLKGNRWHVVLL